MGSGCDAQRFWKLQHHSQRVHDMSRRMARSNSTYSEASMSDAPLPHPPGPDRGAWQTATRERPESDGERPESFVG